MAQDYASGKIKTLDTITNTVNVDGEVEVTNTVAVSGTVAVNNTVAVSGAVNVNNTVGVDGLVKIKDGANLDAFSRLRVSNATALFASQCQYDADPLLFETGATGTGVAPAHDANTRMVALSATAGNGESFIQSYESIPYQAGRSQLVFCTFNLGAGVAGAVVDVGLFNAGNGFFLRQNGASGLQLVRRTSTSGSVVDNVINQADWNIDPMDGTGPSGLTLDPATVQILCFDAQYLAMGRARVYFDIGGLLIEVHHFEHANVISVPYMQTLTLPIQMLLTATATGATKTAHFKCSSVSSEGGFEEDLGYSFATPEGTVTAASGAPTHILGLRPATTFNSIANRVSIRATSIEVLVTGADPVRWELTVGAAFSAEPTWAAVNATYSSAEYTSVVGTVSSVGLVIASGYLAASNQTKSSVNFRVAARYPVSLDRAGAVRANGTLHLFVTGIGGTSASRATLNYTEVR